MPKPVKKKKKFITKKESTTYRLIPGFVEDELPQDEDPDQLESRKKEQREYGIFFDDSYNYMKHLRSLEETATLVSTERFRVDKDVDRESTVGSTVPFMEFFSTDETPEEEIDPEILEAMDNAPVVALTGDEAGAEGEGPVEDDFITQAGGVLPVQEMEDLDQFSGDEDFWSEEEDETSEYVDSDEADFSGDNDEKSAIVPGGRGTFQDDVAAAQTALILKNYEEGRGFCISTAPEQRDMPTAEDYKFLIDTLEQDEVKNKPVSWSEVLDDRSERAPVDPSKYVYEDVDEYEWKEVPTKPKYDCVTILSLNSNTRNLPRDIVLPESDKSKKKREKREQQAAEAKAAGQEGLTLKQLEKEMWQSRRADKADTFRPQDETAEEKKVRKKAVKEERKERRQEKKANKQVFSIEREKMNKETARLAKSVKSVKIH